MDDAQTRAASYPSASRGNEQLAAAIQRVEAAIGGPATSFDRLPSEVGSVASQRARSKEPAKESGEQPGENAACAASPLGGRCQREDLKECLLGDAEGSEIQATDKVEAGSERCERLQFFGGFLSSLLLTFALVCCLCLGQLLRTRGHAAAVAQASVKLRGPLLHPATQGRDGAHSITFVTAETRGRSLLESVTDFPAGFGAPVINVGLNKSWSSFKTKVELLRDYLVGLRKRRTEQGESNRDHYVAFFDGKDVFWGGCSPGDFLRAYRRIVEASGASIVFGAEIVCGEQDCNKVPPVPSWASDLAGGLDLQGGFWETYNEGCHGTWDDECAAKRDCGYAAPCAEPPSVKFLNSGFFLGPVDDLTAMLEWSLANFDNTSVYGDQSVFSKWWELNPEKLTLDYLGELSLQLSDLDWNLLSPRRREGIVWNNGFDRVQCLIHGNGRGSFFAAHLLRHLTDGQDQHGLRGWGSDTEQI